uniref:alpha/beta hydrolase n=1 Tax=Aquitalea sp. ASV15 TaxID=2795104 RepID=UPI001E380928
LLLFGHSMGSFIARSYFLQYGEQLSGLLLSATGYRQRPLAYVPVSYTHLTLPTNEQQCRSRWSPCH